MRTDGALQERGQRLQFGHPGLRTVHRNILKLALQYLDLLLIESSVAPRHDEPETCATWRRKLCELVPEWRTIVSGEGEPSSSCISTSIAMVINLPQNRHR
jgi:hypothetical protein